ncbi:DUF5693 family protein [Paenibacillus woosongensis]|uniref:DUF5693 family protein n=1 Tax=Paenibacillus woosongensis TaxID=307580 RepID=A0AA95IB34_9BACL|nr:DUF5693 family protein [Paenibacillus woosongensis]WHX48753.1 DUF5693 family protein [Paenibacillus woosongensis]
MIQGWPRWNNASRKWLWILVVIGIVASLPVIYQRIQTEASAKKVEFVFNYRGLLEVASYQADPAAFMNEQLDRLKNAGVGSMAMFETTLDELSKARRIMLFTAADVAKMNQGVIAENGNYTYIAFTNEENDRQLRPLIEKGLRDLDIATSPWQYGEQGGLIIGAGPEDAVLKPLLKTDPIAFAMLRDKGFNIVPRLSDNVPFNEEDVDKLLSFYKDNGVKRIMLDGEGVKGYREDEELNSVETMAALLNKHELGVVVIENMKVQPKGFHKIAYLTGYNAVRLFSLSDTDVNLDTMVVADKIALATKDRNIRMIYFNAAPSKDLQKGAVTNPLDNIIHTLLEPGDAAQRVKDNGFELGQAGAFQVVDSSWQTYLKAIVIVGGVAFVALLVSIFAPSLTLGSFLLGLVGSAGLYVLKPTLLEQALALFVAISAPTVAMILAIRKVRDLSQAIPNMSAGRRLSHSLVLYFKTAVLSLSAVPFVIALLNNITYSLVLSQFRGVSLLHLAPVFLVAVYIMLYKGTSLVQELRAWMRMPITLVMVVGAVVLGAAAFYYLSRTGNAGTPLPGEAAFRSMLENTFGVRPRNKEFLFAHPLFIVGIFAALRYRWALYAMIVAVIGQLSMVDTFAHIHTPAVLSLIRGLLGLGLGLIFGLLALLVWYILERCWEKWSPRLLKP